MNYTTVMEQISSGRIAPVYLLYGEEPYLISEIEQLLLSTLLPGYERDMGLTQLDNDPSPDSLVRMVETSPFFSSKNVILIRGTNFFRPKKGAGSNEEEGGQDSKAEDSSDKLVKLMSSIPDYTHLIFVTGDKVDRRKKLFKAIEKYGAAVEINPLKPKDVRPWITAKLSKLNKKMTADALEHLLSILSIMPQISLSFLASELEKASLYCHDKRTISREDLLAIMSHVPEVSVFAMLEALSQKQAAKAIELLGDQLAGGEYPFRLLALLARQVRMLWQAKTLNEQGYGSDDIANELKIPSFVGEKLLRQSRSFSEQALKESLLRLAAADRDMKSGRADGTALEQIVIELCR